MHAVREGLWMPLGHRYTITLAFLRAFLKAFLWRIIREFEIHSVGPYGLRGRTFSFKKKTNRSMRGHLLSSHQRLATRTPSCRHCDATAAVGVTHMGDKLAGGVGGTGGDADDETILDSCWTCRGYRTISRLSPSLLTSTPIPAPLIWSAVLAAHRPRHLLLFRSRRKEG